jgi:carbamoylphosphate synthase large subunit
LEKQTILIGAAGTGTAFATICRLRHNWLNQIEIHGMDINPSHLVSASLFCDKFHQCPLSSSDDFFPFLVALVASEKIKSYLPLLPNEISLAQKHLTFFKKKGITVILASKQTETNISDKWQVYLKCQDSGIPCPMTFQSLQPSLGDIFFIKHRFGFGSQDSFKSSTKDVRLLNLETGQYLFQQLCDGPEVTVDAFFDPENNRIFTIGRERIEVKAGVCVKARIFQDVFFDSMARKLAESFSIAGSFCFQMMKIKGDWVLTDLNPRTGAGTAISAACGADFLSANFAYAFGLEYNQFFPEIENEIFVTRQYSEFVHRNSK